MSAFELNADVVLASQNVCWWAQSRHQRERTPELVYSKPRRGPPDRPAL